MKIAVLMTCYNRVETTIRCLKGLLAQVGNGRVEGVESVEVFVVDDGSTDGTWDSLTQIASRYAELDETCVPTPLPAAGRHDYVSSRLHLIRGAGNLYWAKGMHLAWCKALEEEKLRSSTSDFNYSGFLWLNDDVELNADALSKLELEVGVGGERILVGELVNARGEVTYGKRGDLFTGNFVYVPRSVYEKIGMISGEYAHAWADSDYAMRAKRAGVKVVSLGVVGKCEGHPNRPSLRGRDLRWRWRSLWDPKGWNVHDLWVYRRRNWGVCAAIASCTHLIVHVLMGER